MCMVTRGNFISIKISPGGTAPAAPCLPSAAAHSKFHLLHNWFAVSRTLRHTRRSANSTFKLGKNVLSVEI